MNRDHVRCIRCDCPSPAEVRVMPERTLMRPPPGWYVLHQHMTIGVVCPVCASLIENDSERVTDA